MIRQNITEREWKCSKYKVFGYNTFSCWKDRKMKSRIHNMQSRMMHASQLTSLRNPLSSFQFLSSLLSFSVPEKTSGHLPSNIVSDSNRASLVKFLTIQPNPNNCSYLWFSAFTEEVLQHLNSHDSSRTNQKNLLEPNTEIIVD